MRGYGSHAAVFKLRMRIAEETLFDSLSEKFDDNMVMTLGDEPRTFLTRMRCEVVSVVMPDQALAWSFIWWVQLLLEHEAGTLDTNQNKSELRTLQAQVV